MFTFATTGFGTFWSVLTSTSADRPVSPVGEAPKLVYLRRSSESLTRQDLTYSSESPALSTKELVLDHQSDISRGQIIRPAPTRQRLKTFMSQLRPPQRRASRHVKPEPHECLAHHCTLCRKEIPPTHFYASRPKKIQQDDTYISTRCCHQTVHSPCYRITLQYFIDSKGRPRCPICREYPDLFIACWALGYVFDKDIGDIDDEECECGDHMTLICDVCQGRKQLLRDLQNMRSGIQVEVEMGLGTDQCAEKGVRLFTIIEGEEEEG